MLRCGSNILITHRFVTEYSLVWSMLNGQKGGWNEEGAMTTYLPEAVLAGLSAARQKETRKSSKYRVEVGGAYVPVIELTQAGFSVAQDAAPQLRGHVDLFEGPRHLFRCLIVASDSVGEVMQYEFKHSTPAAQGAALDYVADRAAPHALIEDIRAGL
jgi:hypothetical protein